MPSSRMSFVFRYKVRVSVFLLRYWTERPFYWMIVSLEPSTVEYVKAMTRMGEIKQVDLENLTNTVPPSREIGCQRVNAG